MKTHSLSFPFRFQLKGSKYCRCLDYARHDMETDPFGSGLRPPLRMTAAADLSTVLTMTKAHYLDNTEQCNDKFAKFAPTNNRNILTIRYCEKTAFFNNYT